MKAPISLFRFVVVAVVLLPAAAPASASTETSGWTRQFGTSDADEALGVALDQAGNGYVVGWTAATLQGQTSAGTVDAFVRKYDPAGNQLWTRQFGSWDSDFARAVATDRAGNVYVVGETEGTLPGQHSAGGHDAFARKYDSDGTELWTRQFGGGGGEGAWGVALDPAGNAYVVGTTGGALPGQTSAGSFDAFVRKYDPGGEELWTRQFGGGGGEGARGVAIDPTGDVLVVGSTEGGLPGQHWAGGFDAYIRQYDPAGTELWTRQFGTQADDYGMAVAVEPAGNVSMVGSTDGALPGQSSAGGTEAFLRRFNPIGAELWTQQFATGSADDAWDVAADTGGNAYVVGTTEKSSPGQTSPPKTHCFVRKYDPAGKDIWIRQFASQEADLIFSVRLDPTGDPWVAGSTRGVLAGQTTAGGRDAFVIREENP